MKRLIGGNFKMNKTQNDIKIYFETFLAKYQNSETLDVVICPQTAHLSYTKQCLQNTDLHLGAQNMHYETSGAFTGETSPLALLDLGCSYVILGHSERRMYYNETYDFVNKKIASAIKHNIRPIVCIGETLAERENNQTADIIQAQLLQATKDIDTNQIDIAYEPVRSIGTGKIPNTKDIQEIHTLIRKLINNTQTRILYGGSSNDQNAAELIEIPEVNGFLVGGASLDPEKFLKMIEVLK